MMMIVMMMAMNVSDNSDSKGVPRTGNGPPVRRNEMTCIGVRVLPHCRKGAARNEMNMKIGKRYVCTGQQPMTPHDGNSSKRTPRVWRDPCRTS